MGEGVVEFGADEVLDITTTGQREDKFSCRGCGREHWVYTTGRHGNREGQESTLCWVMGWERKSSGLFCQDCKEI